MEAFYKELVSQVVMDIRKELLPEIKSFIKEQVEAAMKIVKGKKGMEEEYMPKKYFLEKYEFSGETFRRILKSGHVHSYYKTGRKLYNLEQFKKALDAYKPQKPLFKDTHLHAA